MKLETTLCPVCEAGQLSPARHELTIQHGGQTLTVRELEHAECDACGADPVLTTQIRRNQRRIADARRRADDMLIGEEIRVLRTFLGINQQQAAMLFGGGINAFSKYERGDVIQSVAMDRLLKAAVSVPGMYEFLQAEAGMAPTLVTSYSGSTWLDMKQESFTSRSVRGSKVNVVQLDWSPGEPAEAA